MEGRVVLIAEDNDDQRQLLRQALELFDYRVVEARDGEDAMVKARETPPDVIVMDLSMPGMGGIETTRRLKSDERTAAIPIVVLTAHALFPMRVQAEAAGCDAYLTKPILPSEVRRAIELVLRKG